MIKQHKLFLFGSIGVLANLVFFILFDFIDFYLWVVYLYGGGSYPHFLNNYGVLIAKTNSALFFLFLGFTVGVGLCGISKKDE